MASTQKWVTAAGTVCTTQEEGDLLDRIEGIAELVNSTHPGVHRQTFIKTLLHLHKLGEIEVKLLTRPSLPNDADFGTLRDAFSQLTRYGTPYPGVVEAVEKIADMNDDMAHGREPDGAKPYVEWRVA
jgi:hypothetical protein